MRKGNQYTSLDDPACKQKTQNLNPDLYGVPDPSIVVMFFLAWWATWLCQFNTTRIILERGTSVKKLPPADWPMGMSVGIF